MTRFLRNAFLSLAVSALSGAACKKADEDGANTFRDSLPTKETVEVKVPGAAAGQALSVERKDQAVLGAVSDSYKLTVGVRDIINGGTFWVLTLVKTITTYPPTSVGENSAVWGPWADALEANAYRLTVTRTAPNTYAYVLHGKDKTKGDDAFVVVLSGTHAPALDASGEPIENFGAGSFTLDWNAARTLPKHDADERGTLTVNYDRPSLDKDTNITAKFVQVWDKDEMRLVDADYAHTRKADGGGTLDFVYMPADGRALIRSRWLPTGAGRSDWKVEAPGLPMPGLASDCWGPAFRSIYYTSNYEPAKNYGEETSCAFTPAEYSKLSL